MKQSADLKPKKTVRDLKLEMIEMLKTKYGSSPFIDQLQREVDSSEESDSKKLLAMLHDRPMK
jgi:hypothetical protein